MAVEIRFYRNQERRPQVQAAETFATLADFLISDVQEEETCAEILKASAQKKQQEINGNSYTIILTPETITFENMFDDEEAPYQITGEQFREIISGWKEFLENPGLLSLVPKL